MKRLHWILLAAGLVVSVGVWQSWVVDAQENQQAAATKTKLDQEALGKVGGVTPTATPDGVVKLSWPRNDVPVQIDGLKMPPFMGLTSWAAFAPGGKQEAMLMGDIVLFQDEVNPAMDAAFAAGIDVTALHNHFFFDEPKVFFMHIGGEGKAAEMAAGVRTVIERAKQVRSGSMKPATSFGLSALPEKSSISAEPLTAILGGKPAAKDGMVKFTIGRTVKMPCGCEIGKEMGVNTWAAFYGSDDNAMVDGDFATFAGELQTVLRTLRSRGINIVAIHSHMEGEAPHVVFLHYWGRGPAAELAQGVKAALVAQEKIGADSK